MANALDSLGFIAHHSDHHKQAISYYEEALAMFRALSVASEAANTLDRLGQPYAALGHHEKARAVWREALELYEQQGCGTDTGRAQQQLDELNDPGGALDSHT